jgi:hypothetical protein
LFNGYLSKVSLEGELMQVRLRKLLFGLSPAEATFARRGFRTGDPAVCERLEQIGMTFLAGYHAALHDSQPLSLYQKLNHIDHEFCGFAYEGAAMALTLLDRLFPWRPGTRLPTFLQGAGAAHLYMMHVGAGWTLARLPWRTRWPPPWLDPLLGWLALDGYGFHAGYFHWPSTVRRQAKPKRLAGWASQVFDQGLGRSLWFVEGADTTQIPCTIANFAPHRHADLWSGVGLACTYAGGVDADAIQALRMAAGPFGACLAQGAAFAAKARQRACNPAPHSELACSLLCGCSAQEAAQVTDVALVDLPADGAKPAYAIWRQRIQQLFAHREA